MFNKTPSIHNWLLHTQLCDLITLISSVIMCSSTHAGHQFSHVPTQNGVILTLLYLSINRRGSWPFHEAFTLFPPCLYILKSSAEQWKEVSNNIWVLILSTFPVVMENAFLKQAKWSIRLWSFQKLLALRLCTSPRNLFNYHTTLTLLIQAEYIVPQTKGSPTVCYQNSPEKQREVEESIFHLSERHITVRLSYNTLCGKLFLTWLTLNEASDEKKMLFSLHSWARSGFAMSYVFVCLSLCVCVCVYYQSEIAFIQPRPSNYWVTVPVY